MGKHGSWLIKGNIQSYIISLDAEKRDKHRNI